MNPYAQLKCHFEFCAFVVKRERAFASRMWIFFSLCIHSLTIHCGEREIHTHTRNAHSDKDRERDSRKASEKKE